MVGNCRFQAIVRALVSPHVTLVGRPRFSSSCKISHVKHSLMLVKKHSTWLVCFQLGPNGTMNTSYCFILLNNVQIPTNQALIFPQIYKDVKHRNRRQLTMSGRTSATSTQQARRKQEDNLAVVFLGIVLVFLVCHTPRNLLSLAEMFFIRNSLECQKTGQRSFPYWTLVGAAIRFVKLVRGVHK